MPRRNLTGLWGESRVLSVRVTSADFDVLRRLGKLWGGEGAPLTDSEVVRRALREAAAANPTPAEPEAPKRRSRGRSKAASTGEGAQ